MKTAVDMYGPPQVLVPQSLHHANLKEHVGFVRVLHRLRRLVPRETHAVSVQLSVRRQPVLRVG